MKNLMAKDYTGMTFGNIKIIRVTIAAASSRYAEYEAKCAMCNSTFTIGHQSIKVTGTIKCKECNGHGGETYGNLIVIKRDRSYTSAGTYYIYCSDCKKVMSRALYDVKNGKTNCVCKKQAKTASINLIILEFFEYKRNIKVLVGAKIKCNLCGHIYETEEENIHRATMSCPNCANRYGDIYRGFRLLKKYKKREISNIYQAQCLNCGDTNQIINVVSVNPECTKCKNSQNIINRNEALKEKETYGLIHKIMIYEEDFYGNKVLSNWVGDPEIYKAVNGRVTNNLIALSIGRFKSVKNEELYCLCICKRCNTKCIWTFEEFSNKTSYCYTCYKDTDDKYPLAMKQSYDKLVITQTGVLKYKNTYHKGDNIKYFCYTCGKLGEKNSTNEMTFKNLHCVYCSNKNINIFRVSLNGRYYSLVEDFLKDLNIDRDDFYNNVVQNGKGVLQYLKVTSKSIAVAPWAFYTGETDGEKYYAVEYNNTKKFLNRKQIHDLVKIAPISSEGVIAKNSKENSKTYKYTPSRINKEIEDKVVFNGVIIVENLSNGKVRIACANCGAIIPLIYNRTTIGMNKFKNPCNCDGTMSKQLIGKINQGMSITGNVYDDFEILEELENGRVRIKCLRCNTILPNSYGKRYIVAAKDLVLCNCRRKNRQPHNLE